MYYGIENSCVVNSSCDVHYKYLFSDYVLDKRETSGKATSFLLVYLPVFAAVSSLVVSVGVIVVIFKRYIFKDEQNAWRPVAAEKVISKGFVLLLQEESK